MARKQANEGLIHIKNIGKILEEQWKKSVPDYALLFRLKDSAQAFKQTSSLRFSSKNPFDYILWDSKRLKLYALELKTVKGSSITFERNENETKEIHLHQINGLSDWAKYNNTVCGFIIEFRKLEKTVFIKIDELKRLIDAIPKKSFSFFDLDKFNVKYVLVAQTKKRTRYIYDVDGFLSNDEEKNMEETI